MIHLVIESFPVHIGAPRLQQEDQQGVRVPAGRIDALALVVNRLLDSGERPAPRLCLEGLGPRCNLGPPSTNNADQSTGVYGAEDASTPRVV